MTGLPSGFVWYVVADVPPPGDLANLAETHVLPCSDAPDPSARITALTEVWTPGELLLVEEASGREVGWPQRAPSKWPAVKFVHFPLEALEGALLVQAWATDLYFRERGLALPGPSSVAARRAAEIQKRQAGSDPPDRAMGPPGPSGAECRNPPETATP